MNAIASTFDNHTELAWIGWTPSKHKIWDLKWMPLNIPRELALWVIDWLSSGTQTYICRYGRSWSNILDDYSFQEGRNSASLKVKFSFCLVCCEYDYHCQWFDKTVMKIMDVYSKQGLHIVVHYVEKPNSMMCCCHAGQVEDFGEQPFSSRSSAAFLWKEFESYQHGSSAGSQQMGG